VDKKHERRGLLMFKGLTLAMTLITAGMLGAPALVLLMG
jgi:hypothetical protein